MIVRFSTGYVIVSIVFLLLSLKFAIDYEPFISFCYVCISYTWFMFAIHLRFYHEVRKKGKFRKSS